MPGLALTHRKPPDTGVGDRWHQARRSYTPAPPALRSQLPHRYANHGCAAAESVSARQGRAHAMHGWRMAGFGGSAWCVVGKVAGNATGNAKLSIAAGKQMHLFRRGSGHRFAPCTNAALIRANIA